MSECDLWYRVFLGMGALACLIPAGIAIWILMIQTVCEALGYVNQWRRDRQK